MPEEKKVDWEKKILDCKCALDLLRVEKEAKDQGAEVDDFYSDVWYENVDSLLHRENEFERLEGLEEEMKKLKVQFKKHDHKDSKVVIGL